MPRLPATDQERARWTRFTFLLHLRPVRVPLRTLRWTHTFGLGGSCLVLLVMLAATGGLQMLVYQPVPDVAYDSVVTLEREVAFGSLIRGVHYWSANLLIVVLLLHVARVVLTAGHQGQRRFTWVLGAGLLLGVLTASFTGYLLPWDQLSYWAVTISTGMLTYLPFAGDLLQRVVRGGAEISEATLVNFYTLHTTIVPVAVLLLAAWHFWRVRRAGGVVVPPDAQNEDADRRDPVRDSAEVSSKGTSKSDATRGSPQELEKVLFWPQLMVREISQALILVALIFVLAVLFGAPLGERANPGMSPNPAKAPWYFVGFQEMLIHFHPTFAVLMLPLLAALGFLLLPYLTRNDSPGGTWFLSRHGRRSALLAAGFACMVTPILVYLDERTGAGTAHWFTGGVIPVLGMVLVAWICGLLVKRRPGATVAEAVQSVVVLLTVSFAVLTLIGIWFRGPGMALSWPWAGGVA